MDKSGVLFSGKAIREFATIHSILIHNYNYRIDMSKQHFRATLKYSTRYLELPTVLSIQEVGILICQVSEKSKKNWIEKPN